MFKSSPQVYYIFGLKDLKILNLAPMLKAVYKDLVSLRQFMPLEFAHKPKTLTEFLQWKATHLLQFLLCTSPIVLNKYLKPKNLSTFWA